MLVHLDQARDETAREFKAKDQFIIELDLRILKLQEVNHFLKTNRGSAQDEMKIMLSEIWQREEEAVHQGLISEVVHLLGC